MLKRALSFLPDRERKYDLLKIVAKNLVQVIRQPIRPPFARMTLPPRSNPGIHASYVGHATVIISFSGTLLLTDPNFASRIKIARRIVGQPIFPHEIKALDIIFVSYAHFDHLDLPSLKQLPRHAMLIIPSRCGDLVESLRFSRVVELGWNEKYTKDDFSILAFPPFHWGRRSPWDNREGCYNRYIVSKNNLSVFFAGDTGYSKSFAAVGQEGKVSLAFFPITAYEPGGFGQTTMVPRRPCVCFRNVGRSIWFPLIGERFILSLEPPDESLKRIRAEAIRLKLEDRVIVLKHGEPFTIPE